MKDRLMLFINHIGVEKSVFERNSKLSNGFVDKAGDGIRSSSLKAMSHAYPELNTDWVKTGNGDMLVKHTRSKDVKFYGGENPKKSSHLIPLYDDVATSGGSEGKNVTLDSVSRPTDYIDAGDWFRNGTAAIRHYGNSMIEYPPGCIIVIKEVFDRELIIPGRDYVIETTEYRTTKRVQRGKDNEHITAYSTNTETYPDGRLIHEPFDVPWRAIRHISLVLGYVVKKNGGTIIYSNSKK